MADILHLGFYTEDRLLLAETSPQYDALRVKEPRRDRVVLALRQPLVAPAPPALPLESEALLQLAALGPVYVSPTAAMAKRDVQEYFVGDVRRAPARLRATESYTSQDSAGQGGESRGELSPVGRLMSSTLILAPPGQRQQQRQRQLAGERSTAAVTRGLIEAPVIPIGPRDEYRQPSRPPPPRPPAPPPPRPTRQAASTARPTAPPPRSRSSEMVKKLSSATFSGRQSPSESPTQAGVWESPSPPRPPSVTPTGSPVRAPSSPVRGPGSPAKELSPVKREGSPVKREGSPVKLTGSPVRAFRSPSRLSGYHVKSSDSPMILVRTLDSAVKPSSSPVRHASEFSLTSAGSPRRTSGSPVRLPGATTMKPSESPVRPSGLHVRSLLRPSLRPSGLTSKSAGPAGLAEREPPALPSAPSEAHLQLDLQAAMVDLVSSADTLRVPLGLTDVTRKEGEEVTAPPQTTPPRRESPAVSVSARTRSTASLATAAPSRTPDSSVSRPRSSLKYDPRAASAAAPTQRPGQRPPGQSSSSRRASAPGAQLPVLPERCEGSVKAPATIIRSEHSLSAVVSKEQIQDRGSEETSSSTLKAERSIVSQQESLVLTKSDEQHSDVYKSAKSEQAEICIQRESEVSGLSILLRAGKNH